MSAFFERRRALIAAWNNPVKIVPTQLGSGTPSLDNYRAILPGYTLRVLVNGTPTNKEFFGGVIDYKSGTVTETHRLFVADGVTLAGSFGGKSGRPNNQYFLYVRDAYVTPGSNRAWSVDEIVQAGMILSNISYIVGDIDYSGTDLPAFVVFCNTANNVLEPRIIFGADSDIDTRYKANAFLSRLYAAGTPFSFVYKIATPGTYRLV